MHLKFNKFNLTSLVEWTKAHTGTSRQAYAEKTTVADSLWLVHDNGIYLMCNTVPEYTWKDFGEKPIPNGHAPDHPVCVYAEGFDPNFALEDGDVWERARQAVGGDDFAENVPLDIIEEALGSKLTHAVIDVTKTMIRAVL